MLRRVKACRYLAASNLVSECNTVIRTLLLDLDGTLVHSLPDLAAALNRLLRARGLVALSQFEVMWPAGQSERSQRVCLRTLPSGR
jgi:hypothetical protein